ncbi:hypothetical protein JCM6882_001961 [Rhodosporidiobolus microsporus]
MASTPRNPPRKTVHRKRSPSPSAGPSPSSQQHPQPGPSTPIMAIKGRYERASAANSTGANKLLHSAVTKAAADAATSSKKPSPAPAPAAAPSPDTRAQFEQQEDFISFDALSEPEEETSGRGTPRDGGGRSARKGKRSRDDRDEERDEEGTRRLRNREKGRSTPWCDSPGVEWRKCETAIEMLNAETRAFVSYISPTPVEHELRLWTIELIRRTIKTHYPDAEVECFGSVGTGLYLPGGDIDLVVLSPSMPSPPLKPQPSLLHRLASLLLTSSLANPSSLVVIAKARVPIVKFTTRYGGFSVDLSVNQKNGVDAAVRVRGMLEDFAFREEGYVEPGSRDGSRAGSASAKSSRATTPAAAGEAKKGGGGGKKDKKGKGKAEEEMDVDSSAEEGEEDEEPERKADEYPVDYGVARCLVLLVKGFLSQRGMNEVFTGGLGSYSIICMVISFLQLHPRIQTSHINPNRNLGLLFVEFLELYGKHFNYDEAGITLRGRGGYYNKHDKGWWRAQQPYLLSIEDPNDPQNDVSGGSHAIIRVRQTFAGGFDTLSATLLHRHSLLSSRKTPSLLPLSSTSLPNADSDPPSQTTQSLLGSIIGMTSAGVEARDANVRLWEDGVLQKLLRRTDPARGGGAKGAEDPTGKKAMKRFRKEEKEREKRERTIRRLERRQEEKELKRERKERKKRERIEGKDAALDAEPGVVEVRPLVGEVDVHAAQAAAASLGGLAGGPPPEEGEEDGSGGFVIDTVGTGAASRLPPPPAAAADDDEDDSRYSLGVPAVTKKASGAASAASRAATYTSANSDSESDEEGEGDDDDDDVVLGGTGGDFVRFDSVGRALSSDQGEEEEENDTDASRSGSASSAEVVEALVPKAKRAKVVPEPSEGGAKNKADKKAKLAARIAYWGKKGPREE